MVFSINETNSAVSYSNIVGARNLTFTGQLWKPNHAAEILLLPKKDITLNIKKIKDWYAALTPVELKKIYSDGGGCVE